MKRILLILCILFLPTLTEAATKSVVPRADSEGGVGTASKRWGNFYTTKGGFSPGLTGLSDVDSATITAGRILVADGTKYQSVAISGSCTLLSSGAISCTSGGATQLTGLTDVGSSTAGAGRLLINDGTDFNSIAMSGDATITSVGVIDLGSAVVGSTELASTPSGSGYFSTANIQVDADGRIVGAAQGSLTGLSDIGNATITAGRLLVADGTDFQSVALSQHCFILSSGQINCNALGAAKTLTGLSDVGSATITAGNILIADGTDFQSKALSGDCTITSAGAITCPAGTNFFTRAGDTIYPTTTGDSFALGASSITTAFFAVNSFEENIFMNRSLGIGTTAPDIDNDIDIQHDSSSQVSRIALKTSEEGSAIDFYVLGGTLASPAISPDSENIGFLDFYAHDGVNYERAARIRVGLDDGVSVGSNDVPSIIQFYTTPDGSNNDLERLVIRSTGRVGIGISGPTSLLSVGGGIQTTGYGYQFSDGSIQPKAAASSLTGLADVGSATITAGRLLIADGTKYQSAAMSGDCTITSAGVVDCPSGAGATSLTGLSDVESATIAAGTLLIADGTKFQSKSMSGDATITSAGVIEIASGVVGATELASYGAGHGFHTTASFTVDVDGRIVQAARGSLTGLSDIGSATITAGRLLIADGTDFESVAVSIAGGALAANGSLTTPDPARIVLFATAATYIDWYEEFTGTINRFRCWTKSGTATADLRQCGTPNASCSSVLPSTLSVTTTASDKQISAAASAITAGNYLEINGSSWSTNKLECYVGISR